MKKNFLTMILTLVAVFAFNSQSAFSQVDKGQKGNNRNSTKVEPADEATLLWNDILADNVSREGVVNYRMMKEDSRFDKAYQKFSETIPLDKWSDNRAKAFWINLYNINTVKLVMDNYPMKSIKDLGKPWDKKFINVGGSFYSLNDIENNILRTKFDDARIHFAINCGSFSCPKLDNKAYMPQTVETMLNKSAYAFINDKDRNTITPEKAEISEIFKWYEADFTNDTSLVDFINKYSKVKIDSNTKLEYKTYDWSLNE